MKIKNIKNPKKFFERLERCTGSVELCTSDGNRFNLKSKLSQYIFMMNIFDKVEMPEMDLLFSEPSDTIGIMEYLMLGE